MLCIMYSLIKKYIYLIKKYIYNKKYIMSK